MFARFFYRLFLKLFARRIVRAAYQGILGRAPDPDGLAAYARDLAVRRDLAFVLGDLAQSEEARRRLAPAPGNARRARAVPTA